MGLIIGIAAKLVGEKFAGLAVYGTAILLVLGAIWWLRADAYSDGVAATDAKWEEAGRRLEQQAAEAAAAADDRADDRQAQEFDRVQQEKEKLDAASASGGSPWDVLFGP